MPLTDTGAVVLAKLLIGEAQTPYTTANARIGVGNSSAAFAKTHTDLQATSPNKLRKQMDSGFPTRSGNILTLRATFAPAEAVWTWSEWGVFNAATLGEMLSRKVEAIGPKTSSQTWQVSASIVVTAESTTIGEVLATSALLAHVQAAVDEAVDGDTVLIPDGVATWSSGITTTKQIRIEAQNYTPTPAGTAGAGATSRNVTITNNSSSPLFAFTSGNSFHVGVAGIAFHEGSGDGSHISFSGTGTKVPLINDCYFQNKSRQSPAQQIIVIACRGGVMWNCYMQGTQAVTLVGEGSLLIKYPTGVRNWTTASTMGAADTNGDWNFYVEDSTFKNVGACPDIDDHGRFVCRHFVYDGTWGATHGFTSLWGGRHWEFYDGHFKSTTDDRNFANRYFWCRAGTGIFTGNIVDEDFEPSDYGGTPDQLNIGDNTSPGSYLMPRQPGCGHNGTTYVSDPIYIWGQTGELPYGWSFQGSPGGWEGIVVEGRDIFVNAGAKPGYTKFTYPHPLRSEI